MRVNKRFKDLFSKAGHSNTIIVCHVSASDGPLLLVYKDSKETYCYNGDIGNLLENYLANELYDLSGETPPSSSTSDFTHSQGTSIGKSNALRSAKSYLDYSGFSRNGLIEQLEFEGYTYSEATYAVDACGADWKKQALRVAKSYLDYSAFSRSGLINQLEYEGFTYEQAVYGTEHSGANWKEQAARMAKSYLSYSSFSRSSLIDQLEYEGFTYEQAVYGAKQNGY